MPAFIISEKAELGPSFVTLGHGLTAKVKDEVEKDSTIKKVCTAEDLSAVGARSRVTAVVNSEFSHEFDRSVRWQKTDRQGNPLEPDEDDATLDPEDQPGQGDGDGGGAQIGQ
jgi:hypothetical protein